MRNLFGNRRGANAVEFAMCLPILLSIVSATVDHGWYLQQRMVLTTANQQAAKAAANEDTNYSAVGVAVGEKVWLAAGYGTLGQGAFVVSVITPGVANQNPNGVDDCIQVVSSVPVECLVCLNAIPMAATISHTAVEYWYDQPPPA